MGANFGAVTHFWQSPHLVGPSAGELLASRAEFPHKSTAAGDPGA